MKDVLLTIRKYDGHTSKSNYFICPDYDGKAGIQNAKIEFIDFEYWENCEKGKGEGKILTFERKKNIQNWFLIMPCGGTETSISISKIMNPFFRRDLHLFNNCPPCIEITNFEDGEYKANMVACGLGGAVTFELKSK